MLRTGLRRLMLPLWAVWLALAVTERPLSYDCWMHDAASHMAGSKGLAATGTMHHHAHPGSSRTAGADCCGCLGDCGAAPVAVVPGGGTVVAALVAPIVRYTPELTTRVAPALRTDLALPHANAPPLFALI